MQLAKLEKKGLGSAKVIVSVLIGITVAFILFANLIPIVQTNGQNLSDSGLPLGSLFASNGIVIVLLMVGLLLFAIKHLGSGK